MKRAVIYSMLGLVLLGVGFGAYKIYTDRGWQTTNPKFENLSGKFINGKLHYPADPAVKLGFVPDYKYLGGQKFVLYGTADVEQHFFVKPDADDKTQSVVFIQFESVSPGVNWQYDYSSSPLREQFGAYDFFTNTRATTRHPIFWYGRPGSDGYLARKFVADKGYPAPKDHAYARLVHLPTKDRRKEMIVIFMDNLAPTGYTGKDLQPGGSHQDKWADLSRRHLINLRAIMHIESLTDAQN